MDKNSRDTAFVFVIGILLGMWFGVMVAGMISYKAHIEPLRVKLQTMTQLYESQLQVTYEILEVKE